MNKSYHEFTRDELLLRDYLAIDRTMLANERTFLSYLRTTLALLVVGVTLIHFSQELSIAILGGLFIVSGCVLLGVGIRRTALVAKDIATAKHSKRKK